jgi:Tfp pilus assembly protein FimT
VGPASERGVALADALAATALIALLSATTIPVVAGALENEHTRVGAHYLGAVLQRTQLDALRRGTSVALRLTTGAIDTEWQAFADGNGNGVLARDIEQGIDFALGPADRIGAHARKVSLRINQAVPEIGEGGTVLAAGSDPVRIGRSALLSFSPTGSATAGTLYVSAPRGPQMAIRITGPTGRVRILRYDLGARAWLP